MAFLFFAVYFAADPAHCIFQKTLIRDATPLAGITLNDPPSPTGIKANRTLNLSVEYLEYHINITKVLHFVKSGVKHFSLGCEVDRKTFSVVDQTNDFPLK